MRLFLPVRPGLATDRPRGRVNKRFLPVREVSAQPLAPRAGVFGVRRTVLLSRLRCKA